MINNKSLRAFLAGSSFPVIFWPFSLLAVGFLQTGNEPFQFQYVVWVFPILLGLANVVFWMIEKNIPFKKYPHKLWAFGLFLGMCFPIMGGQLNVPHQLFGFPADKQFLIIPLGMVFYGCIWRYAVGFMNRALNLNK